MKLVEALTTSMLRRGYVDKDNFVIGKRAVPVHTLEVLRFQLRFT